MTSQVRIGPGVKTVKQVHHALLSVLEQFPETSLTPKVALAAIKTLSRASKVGPVSISGCTIGAPPSPSPFPCPPFTYTGTPPSLTTKDESFRDEALDILKKMQEGLEGLVAHEASEGGSALEEEEEGSWISPETFERAHKMTVEEYRGRCRLYKTEGFTEQMVSDEKLVAVGEAMERKWKECGE